jgi:hypothetical protein
MSVAASGRHGDLHRLLESLRDLSSNEPQSIPPPHRQVHINITKRYRACDALALNVNAVQEVFDVVVSENFSLCQALLAREPFLKWMSFSGDQETDDFYLLVRGRTYSDTASRMDSWVRSLLHTPERGPVQLFWTVRPQHPHFKHVTPFRLPQPRPSRVV